MDLFETQKLHPHIFKQFILKDILFLYYSCPQRDKILQLYSKHIQFNFTISGKRIFHHGNNSWVSDQNKGLLVKKCAFLQELPPDYEGWDVLVFYLKDDYLRAVFEEFRPYLNLDNLPDSNEEMLESFAIDDQIRFGYQSLIPYFGSKRELPDSILEGKFKELLFNIFVHPDNKHVLAYILRIVDRYAVPIWKVMEENFMYDLKIKDFANISNRSLSTFKNDFKNYYHTSPAKWLTERRLKRAKSILESSNKTIREIAFESGFNNASHFSRVFKDAFGMNPSDLRNVPTK